MRRGSSWRSRRSTRLERNEAMKNVHLIGVCGTAMATLAAMLKRRGYKVAGSDQNMYPPMSDLLVAEGIRTFEGFAPEHITSDLDLVIVGNAISRGNPELEEVLDRKIRYCSLPEMVRDEFLWGARSIVIAGRPRGTRRESPPAATRSGSSGRAPPRAPGCRARSRCRRPRDPGRR